MNIHQGRPRTPNPHGLLKSLQKKTLYHGSNMAVDRPGENYSALESEFGYGFYTSVSEQYAVDRAIDKVKDSSEGVQILNEYVFDDEYTNDGEREDLEIHYFRDRDEWLDYMLACRRISYEYGRYDVLAGPIMDDGTVEVLDKAIERERKYKIRINKRRLYKEILKTREKSLPPIDFEDDDGRQYVFKTRKGINHLSYKNR